MMNRLGQIAIVLVKPKAPGNVGSAARALKNMGLGDLRVVAPRDWDARGRARMMAVHAATCSRARASSPTCLRRCSDRTLIVGTTCRTGPYRSEVRPLREAAERIALATATNRLAIVFGPEDYGLSNEEIGQCHRLMTIPVVA